MRIKIDLSSSFLFVLLSLYSCSNHISSKKGTSLDMYDGPAAAMKYEFDNTKDPTTNRVPRELLWPAIEYTDQLKQDIRQNNALSKATLYGWTERGPNSDATGPSNGNTRANNGVASGRIRAVMVDVKDTSGNTVFVGGVAGGIWKTTSINLNPAGWTLINDKFANLAITSICQDPKRPDTMYFCTGEPNYNSDAVQGDGVFKSTNGGNTWTQLSATTTAISGDTFNFCSRIVCDTLGNVYVGTRRGLMRSNNYGTSWTSITPSGLTPIDVSDIRISSTGRLHMTTGFIFSGGVNYRYTDVPASANSATGWTSSITPFPTSGIDHVVLACQNNTLLVLPSSSSTNDVATIYQSTDGGANWSALANTPGFTSGQGWYNIAAAINPSNTSQYMVGSLDCYKTTNAGASAWTAVSTWVGTGGLSYVHADQHNLIWYNTSTQNRVLVVCDGGIHLSTDGGNTFTDRNTGLRIKQFYSVAIHPSTTNYLIGGAQDNGCHQFSNAGLSSTVEITGGDGAFTQIDQDQPQYQFGSYVFNQYRRSTTSGTSWTSVNFSSTAGRFINPIDYDNANNIMYCSDIAGSYRRWTDPQTGSTSAVVAITTLNSSSIYSVTVSPYTLNKVFFGTAGGRVVMVPSANTIISGSAGTLLGSLTSPVSNIALGGSDDTIMVTSTSYTGTQIYYTTNGTNASPTWTSKDGNLPNIPVHWALLVPGSVGKRAMVATETGVWITRDITAASVTWLPDPYFPNVSTDMLKYRAFDGTVAAATHGRGMWTANVTDLFGIALPIDAFILKGQSSPGEVQLSWNYQTARDQVNFDIERSENGTDFVPVSSVKCLTNNQDYSYNDWHSSTGKIYYRIKSYDQYGLTQYSNTISLNTSSLIYSIAKPYPNPIQQQINIDLSLEHATNVRMQVYNQYGILIKDDGGNVLSTGTQTLKIPLQTGVPGNYILVVWLGDKRYTYPMVKLK